jgi:hypothetical protein
MTEMDDRELSQRLRALRVEPPLPGFEARLAEALRAAAPEPQLPGPRPHELEQREPAEPGLVPQRGKRAGRLIVGPWRRRGPVRLIGATALFLAGAAAAVEGGVVEWVRERVQAVQRPEPASPAPSAAERSNASPRRARLEREAPAPRDPEPPAEPAPPALPEPERGPVLSVPRLAAPRAARDAIERRAEPAHGAAPLPERRPALNAPSVPRLEIDPRGRERRSDPDIRLGRGLGQPSEGAIARERGRDLERIRDIAKARREQAAGNERPRVIERLRERRERINAERRELQERGRPDRRLR